MELKKLPPHEIRRKVEDALDLVELSGLQNRRISEISGGQMQRVAEVKAA